MRRLIVEGWRFLPHSYAIVNQCQCLELLRRSDWELRHRDAPLFQPGWGPTRGLLDAESERKLQSIAGPDADYTADVTYRIAFPFNFKPSTSVRTFVFATSEQQCVPAHHILGAIPLADAMRRFPVAVITPSEWSRQGFIRSGADPGRVCVVPHGVDPRVFRPATPAECEDDHECAASGHFTFLHVGAMSGGKNLPVLLKAFATVAQRFPYARLHLKGLDSLYGSQSLLQRAISHLTQAEIAILQQRIRYSGGTLSLAEIGRLYRSADAYVSPYSAEAFNLPVLEAAASGLPVICTAGGPTDEFTHPDFVLRIDSEVIEAQSGVETIRYVRARLDSLVEQMERVLNDANWRAHAIVAGPSFVRNKFTWAAIVNQLIRIFDANALPTENVRPVL